MKMQTLNLKEMQNSRLTYRVILVNENDVTLRDGIPIEKGVVLTREYLDSNETLFTKYLDLWIRYPDLLLDMIQDAEDAKNFHLMPF